MWRFHGFNIRKPSVIVSKVYAFKTLNHSFKKVPHFPILAAVAERVLPVPTPILCLDTTIIQPAYNIP